MNPTYNFSKVQSHNAGIVIFMPHVTAGTRSNHNLKSWSLYRCEEVNPSLLEVAGWFYHSN